MTARVMLVDGLPVIVLPAEVAERFQLRDQNEVGMLYTPNGVELFVDPERARQLQVARDVMHDDREALAELAK